MSLLSGMRKSKANEEALSSAVSLQAPESAQHDEVFEQEEARPDVNAVGDQRNSGLFSRFKKNSARKGEPVATHGTELPVLSDFVEAPDLDKRDSGSEMLLAKSTSKAPHEPTEELLSTGPSPEPATKPSKLRRFKLVSPMRASTPDSVPIRVIIGYLPEVSLRDAKEYAMGIAEKHFEQMGLAHFDAFPCGQGYAFEVHEGGSGKAYLPEIIDYFKSQGPFKATEPLSVVIKTGTRLVVVQQLREGLTSLVLPEAAVEEPTPWLTGGKQMTPGLNRRTTFLKAGILVAVTGLLAMTSTALFFRLQPYEAPPPPGADIISGDKLPRTQWSKLLGLAPGSYVKAIRFKNGVWQQPDVALNSQTAPSVSEPSSPASAP